MFYYIYLHRLHEHIVHPSFDERIRHLSRNVSLFRRNTFAALDENFHLNVVVNLLDSAKLLPVYFFWSYLSYYKYYIVLLNTFI